MKAVALAIVLALLVGLGAGVVIERDRRQRAPREAVTPAAAGAGEAPSTAGQDERIAALQADLAIVTARLAALEARPPSSGAVNPWSAGPAAPRASADAGAQVEGMRAEMALLIAKRDGEGLVFLARRLAALGEAGYPSIMEIAKLLLEDEEKDPNEFGYYDLDDSLFGQNAGPLMAWALGHPELSPASYRSRAIDQLSGRSDFDVAQLFLSALRTETDPEVVAHLCEGISNRMRAGIAEDVEAAARALQSNEKGIDALLNGLSQLDEPASTDSLKRLAAPEMPVDVRDRARANLMMLSPPESGYLMLSVERGSSWHAAGLRTGDLILDADGKPPHGESYEATYTAPDGTVTKTIGTSEWGAGIGEDDTVVLRVLRDGVTRTVTVRGNDGLWHGSNVEKAE